MGVTVGRDLLARGIDYLRRGEGGVMGGGDCNMVGLRLGADWMQLCLVFSVTLARHWVSGA